MLFKKDLLKYGLIVLILTINSYCSRETVSESPRKRYIKDYNKQFWREKLIFMYYSDYSPDDYTTSPIIYSLDDISSCLINFHYQDIYINKLDRINIKSGDMITTQIMYGDNKKYYVMFYDIRIYDDIEDSKNDFYNLVLTANMLYQNDSRCLLDICLMDSKSHPGSDNVHRLMHFGNINIRLTLAAEYMTGRFYTLNRAEDYDKYHNMNIIFMDEYQEAFEKHLLSCKL